jgi:arylsulfatase A-like enzyme
MTTPVEPARGRGIAPARSASAVIALRVALALVVLAAVGRSLAAPDHRPSFLLFVLDTTRADAVSTHGNRAVPTTPALDALAARGLRYAHAYAQSHWTLPSHVTLFTGLMPSRHRVDVGRMKAPDDLVMIAESLARAGYDTFGVSENPLVGDKLNLVQGFGEFEAARIGSDEVVSAVARWIARRDLSRPFFLFVNVMDAHAPYNTSDENPFLPEGAAGEEREVTSAKVRTFSPCTTVFDERERAVLRGMYLAGVAAADQKLGKVVELLRSGVGSDPLVSVVTSDHGESLGEHGLLHHDYALYEELIHVPLVITGLPGVAPAAISTPVALADVAPSMLRWAGLPDPGDFDGQVLPTSDRGPSERAIVAEHSDPSAGPFARWRRVRRDACDPDGPLFGDSQVIVAYPWKLHRYEGLAAAELFLLDSDPHETNDLAPAQEARVMELSSRLARERSSTAIAAAAPAHGVDVAADEDVVDRLRALGYIGERTQGDARSAGR